MGPTVPVRRRWRRFGRQPPSYKRRRKPAAISASDARTEFDFDEFDTAVSDDDIDLVNRLRADVFCTQCLPKYNATKRLSASLEVHRAVTRYCVNGSPEVALIPAKTGPSERPILISAGDKYRQMSDGVEARSVTERTQSSITVDLGVISPLSCGLLDSESRSDCTGRARFEHATDGLRVRRSP